MIDLFSINGETIKVSFEVTFGFESIGKSRMKFNKSRIQLLNAIFEKESVR